MAVGIEYLLSDKKRRFDDTGALLISATVAPLAPVVAMLSAYDDGSSSRAYLNPWSSI